MRIRTERQRGQEIRAAELAVELRGALHNQRLTTKAQSDADREAYEADAEVIRIEKEIAALDAPAENEETS